MKTHTLIIFALCATSCLGGCAKIRQMTRRDFAVLNDPFLDSPAAAAPGQATPGRATVAATATASASNDTQGYARVGTTQPTPGSPAAQPAATATNPFQMASRARTIVPESTTAGLARIAAGPTTAPVTPPAQSMDMADMSAFMQQQAKASGLTETAADLEADFEAFAAARREEWGQQAKQAKQKVSNEVQQVADQGLAFGESMPSIPDMAFGSEFSATETAQPLIRQMSGQTSATATMPVKEMPNPFQDQVTQADSPNPFENLQLDDSTFAAPSESRQVKNAVLPSMTPRSNPAQEFRDFAAAPESQLTGKIPTESTMPSQANPFEEWHKQQAQAAQTTPPPTTPAAAPVVNFNQPTTQPKQQKKLDDKFGFDVGWRPANMERP